MGTDNRKPLLFFEFGHHYGGSLQSTVHLIEAILPFRDVRVIDVYGACWEYQQCLESAGIPVTILFPGWAGKTTIGGSGLFGRGTALLFSLPLYLRTIQKLRGQILRLQPEIVWVNSEKALFAAWLAIPTRLPLVIYVRENLRKIRWYCALAWFRADLAIGVSKKSLQHLRSTGFAHRNFQVIYNGVDVEAVTRCSRAQTVPLPDLAPGVLRIVLPASLGSPLKGHEVGIRALARWTQTGGKGQLLLCGDIPPGASGSTQAILKRLVAVLGLGKAVFFLGWRKDIVAIMASCDLVLLPSFSEGLPRSLLQGMALGKAVIATTVGGVPELIRDGVDGLLVSPGDVEGLALAFARLADASLRERMGQAARHRVKEYFSLDHQAGEFLMAMDLLAQRP